MSLSGIERKDRRTPLPGFRPSGFFVLRTPLLAFDEWQQFGAGLESASAVGRAELAEVIDRDRAVLRARLRELVARPEIRQALFVASPSLDDGLDVWLRGGQDRANKIQRAVVRYFARMAGRATPFGLFSGCSTGVLADRTRLSLAARPAYQSHTRLDMDYLVGLTREIEEIPAIRQSLSYCPNTSLYRAGGRWRHVEALVKEKRSTHHLVATDASDYLDATIERSRPGKGVADLAQALVDGDPDASIGDEEAIDFVEALISCQLLTSQLAPVVTGPEPIHPLIATLDAIPAGKALARTLAEVRDAMAAVDRVPLGSSPAAYRDIASRLEPLPAKVELSRLFQVDMVKPAKATLSSTVVGELMRGVDLVRRISRRPREDGLARFRDAYTQRYGSREMPLVEVLDEELGIGFEPSSRGAEHAPLLDDIAIRPPAGEELTSWAGRERHLLQKVFDATSSGAIDIALSPDDVEKLSMTNPLPLPDAFWVMGTVMAASPEHLDRGNFRLFFHSACGPSGARMLGRFCHVDPNLRSLVEAHLRAEEACQPEAIFAEIVHLPEGRVGNVLCRPALRDHEIVFLARSDSPSGHQIPVQDLMVSIAGDRIALRSKRLGREIIPRMSNAHAYTARSLGTYRFLCSLQNQGCLETLTWTWGALASVPFLPRVSCGKLILSRATWTLARHELEALGATRDGAMFEAISTLRASRKLPRWVALRDGDNELPIDLENVLSIETLVQLVKHRPHAIVVEIFPDDLCAVGPEGRFVHEIVVPFERTVLDAPVERRRPAKSIRGSRRAFPPGSEWLYAKIYAGTATADRILVDVLSPIVERMIGRQNADRWFFIRYGDPDWHLRLRFVGDPVKLRSEVLPALHEAMAPLLDQGLAWRLQFDTYERETERYGGPEGMELSEQVFHADSDAVIGVLRLLESADARWRIALRGMDMILDDLGLDLDAKLALMRKLRRGFAAEWRADVGLTKTLGAKFRRESKSLFMLLDRANDAQGPLASCIEILEHRSARLAPIVKALRAAEKAQRLELPVVELAPSYLHMHANRLLRAEARAQEGVLYDFLARLYESRIARAETRS
jgi:lantibiotic biosynthesis protein